MDLYDLGTSSWEDSQSVYHALAHLGREALVIVEPANPYVCIGYHQDAVKELDLDFIGRERIPLVRREVGGGAVYLDRGQLFYQFVLRRDNPLVPPTKEAFYRTFLGPVIETFHDFGVAAEFKPVNDIVAHARKISGNGAAEIEDSVVLVGNFILDFNFEMMSRVLRVPDEKFRDKVYKTLRENLTTITRETGGRPTNAHLAEQLVQRCEPLFGRLPPHAIDRELREKADELLALFTSTDWVFSNDHRARPGTEVKIAEGVFVIERTVKVRGGLIRASAVNRESRLSDVHLSGDFFFYPAARLIDLERALEGIRAQPEAIAETVRRFYQTNGIESPGVEAPDFAGALAGPA